jgi:hypothetical protein
MPVTQRTIEPLTGSSSDSIGITRGSTYSSNAGSTTLAAPPIIAAPAGSQHAA